MPKLFVHSTLRTICSSSCRNARRFLAPTSDLCVMKRRIQCLQSQKGFQAILLNYSDGLLSSCQQRKKSTVVVWDSSNKVEDQYAKDEEDSLKRFAVAYSKIVNADRQNPQEFDEHEGKHRQELPQKAMDATINEFNSTSEYDICNERTSMEIQHHSNDFDVFGYMETTVETFKSPSVAHAATTATSSYPFPNEQNDGDEMLEEYLRRDSNRVLDSEIINASGTEQNKQDASYVTINWEKGIDMGENAENSQAMSNKNVKFSPSIQNRFSKRRRARWIVPQGPLFAMRQNKAVNLDIHYHDTLVGLHRDPVNDLPPTGARNLHIQSSYQNSSRTTLFESHEDLHGQEQNIHGTKKNRRKTYGSKLLKNDETKKINKQRICQQIQEVKDLVSGYGGGYSESVPELESEYCHDIFAEERYNHVLLKQKQKKLKHAGFNIPPLTHSAVLEDESMDKPITNLNLNVSYDWSKVKTK